MIKYQLKYGTGVWIDVDDPNASGEIQYSGQTEYIAGVRETLSRQTGAFGHLIGSVTTPIDLDAAMKGAEMQRFRPQIAEGSELVKTYDPGLPKGAIT